MINYQIPVPIGDCSAHFLVDAKTRHVHRAFLMDGGTNAGNYTAWAQILKGLRFIDLELGNNWTFDSWVVTHWDEDHFHGVEDLIVNSDIKFTRCKRNGASITKGNPGSFVSLYFSPKIVLCCGAWDAFVMFEGDYDFLYPFVKESDFVHWNALNAVQKKWQGRKLLRCIWGENLIGLDLFTRTFQFNRNTGNPYKGEPLKKAPETFSYPLILGDSEKIPRFCVVGANGFGIGQPKACQRYPKRNETSVLALLYWPDKQFCSYYTGGDGHTDVFKNHVQEWFKKRWPMGDVEMVKLDHHGSTGENLGKLPHTEKKSKKKVVNQLIEEEKAPAVAVSNDIAEDPPTENKSKEEVVNQVIEEEKAPAEAVSNDIAEEKAPVEEVPPESNTELELEMVTTKLETPDDLEIEVINDKEKAMKKAKEIGIVIEYMKPSKVLVTPGTRHGHPSKPLFPPIDGNAHDEANDDVLIWQLGTF